MPVLCIRLVNSIGGIQKKRLVRFIEWLIMLAAYAYLVYRLVTFDDYGAFAAVFTSSGFKQWAALLCCVLLMPFNLWCEAGKWQQLLREEHPMSRMESLRQVLYGQVAAFVTPYRLGDIPARVLRLNSPERWKQALVLGLYGGLIQTVIIVACGFIPTAVFLRRMSLPYLPQIAVAAGVVLIVFGVLQYKSLPLSIRLSGRQLLSTFVWSTARYACWLIQFTLVLLWVGQPLGLQELCIAIPTYYLFVTLTPNIPIADAGIRGSWAVFTLGLYGVNAPVAALAAISMWLINNLLPVALYLPFSKFSVHREPSERHNPD